MATVEKSLSSWKMLEIDVRPAQAIRGLVCGCRARQTRQNGSKIAIGVLT